jgi:hypothetical protein
MGGVTQGISWSWPKFHGGNPSLGLSVLDGMQHGVIMFGVLTIISWGNIS